MDETRRLIERARRSAEEARRVSAETQQIVRTSREIQHWTSRVQGRFASQAESQVSFHRNSNSLLGLLPKTDFERLAPQLQGVHFSPRQILHRANQPVDYVYFPISGLLSATVVMNDGGAIEVALIGKEGLAGLPALVGIANSPHDVVVQIPGHGLRIGINALHAEMNQGRLLRDVVTGYHAAWMALNTYQTACNGLHSVRRRCCRRLLSTQDRIAADVLPLTHETLALTLGVRRATVTDELHSLQQDGVIDTQRGRITILDRPGLQLLTCECYDTINEAFSRLFQSVGVGSTWPPGSIR